ncbi:hypothetical protein T484DRAFT_2544495 [Baffinella frigidus]|nr:hypothetical protein T484DRAFT_2544495 [Cryptophyta sp. CCMP2293]
MGSRGQTPRTPGGAAEIRPVSAAEDPFQTPRVLTAGSRPSLSRDRENAPPSSRGGDGGQALRIHSPMEMAPNPEETGRRRKGQPPPGERPRAKQWTVGKPTGEEAVESRGRIKLLGRAPVYPCRRTRRSLRATTLHPAPMRPRTLPLGGS